MCHLWKSLNKGKHSANIKVQNVKTIDNIFQLCIKQPLKRQSSGTNTYNTHIINLNIGEIIYVLVKTTIRCPCVYFCVHVFT